MYMKWKCLAWLAIAIQPWMAVAQQAVQAPAPMSAPVPVPVQPPARVDTVRQPVANDPAANQVPPQNAAAAKARWSSP